MSSDLFVTSQVTPQTALQRNALLDLFGLIHLTPPGSPRLEKR